MRFVQLLAGGERHYGAVAAPVGALRERVGLRPADILAAPVEVLREITRIGRSGCMRRRGLGFRN